MKRNEVIALLNEIESSYPVYQWKLGDVDIWPIIKKDIFFRWHNKFNNPSEKPVAKKQSSGRLSQFFQIINSLISLLLFKIKPDRKIQVLYGGISHFRVDENGLFINKFFQPIINDTPSLAFKEVDIDRVIGKQYPNSILFLDDYFWAVRFLSYFKKRDPLNIERFNEFEKEINERLQLGLINYKSTLLSKLNRISTYIRIYQQIFKKYKPEEAYEICYYNDAMFAMSYVANQHNINSYDIQHGGQGSLNFAYNYSFIPTNGINTLPKIFWCWDKASASNIEKWISKQNYHQVVIKGNLWIQYQLKKGDGQLQFPEEKIIIYTLQEKELDNFILDAISATPSGYTWWIRLHPRMMDAQDRITEQLLQRGVQDRVEIERSSTYSLPQILIKSKVHLSKFSGSIIESAQLNIPTLIIDEVGVEIFEDYIESGLASKYLIKDGEKMMRFVLEMINGEKDIRFD